MKHLIIKGEQMSGKTLLADFFEAKTDLFVRDGFYKEDIIEWGKMNEKRDIKISHVFVTNSNIDYKDLPEGMFLIIELKKFV